MRGRDEDSLSRFALLCRCSAVLCLLMMIAAVALAYHGLKRMKGDQ
ncbi:DUF3679 domain-containing protein, partial [Bacillus cereus group sp. N31]